MYNIFKSRTFYTILAMFVIGGLNAIVQILPPDVQTVFMAALSILAAKFHLDTGRGNSPQDN